MKILVTTAPGLESLVKRECEKLKADILEVTDRSVSIEGDAAMLVKLNVWLRCANRVYIELGEGAARDFDELYNLIVGLDWRKYRPKDFPIQVETVTHKSVLSSEPAIQRTAKKAIIESIIRKPGELVPEVDSLPVFRVLVLVRDDQAKILIDSSGDPLHKRGYRLEAGDAPLKETLAAAMIYLSNWRYREPLFDPCCGSGTIPIEAAMIARNIAPGLRRHFAFEKWEYIDPRILENERDTSRSKIFAPGEYRIKANDIDENMIEKALYNAKVAGVASDIEFTSVNYLELAETPENISGTLITNPPYGERLEDTEVDEIHAQILRSFSVNRDLSGGVITNHEDFIRSADRAGLTKRKLFNGSIECQYCFRKYTKGGNLPVKSNSKTKASWKK